MIDAVPAAQPAWPSNPFRLCNMIGCGTRPEKNCRRVSTSVLSPTGVEVPCPSMACTDAGSMP